MTFNELADRCEAATGPDRELNGDIAVACKLVPRNFERYDKDVSIYDGGRFHHVWSPKRPHEYDAEGRDYEAPAFTSSIDAALTLVPEGWRLGTLGEDTNGKQICHLVDRQTGQRICGYTDALPLALCAAALRTLAISR